MFLMQESIVKVAESIPRSVEELYNLDEVGTVVWCSTSPQISLLDTFSTASTFLLRSGFQLEAERIILGIVAWSVIATLPQFVPLQFHKVYPFMVGEFHLIGEIMHYQVFKGAIPQDMFVVLNTRARVTGRITV
jgi:hypothetical protein